jgi:hypothetical protein
MSNMPSATRKRESERAHRTSASVDSQCTDAPKWSGPRHLRPRVEGTARARPRRPSLRIVSNLGEPAGVLAWEREFLLPLAVDVLEDFVGNADEEIE